MGRYNPERKELVKRSDLVYGLYKEIKEGRGPVFMDATEIPAEEYDSLEQVHHLGILERLQGCGVNYRKDRFEWISPSVHTFLGGVRINANGQTQIRNLYAAGENAGGLYGADRVGTYLTACAVFGFKVGMNAAKASLRSNLIEPSEKSLKQKLREINKIKTKREGKPAGTIKKEIKDIAIKNIACERNEQGLRKAIKRFENIVQEKIFNIKVANVKDFIKTLEIRNLSQTGRMISEAALRRKETRGQHRRTDFPERDDAFRKWILLRNDQNKIRIQEEKITF
jgi:fumarate reductase (CoM/CoB) subunit A